MLAGIVNYIVVAILNWIAQLIGVQIKHAADAAEDKKINDGIQKGIEDAKSEQESQDALNKAAARLGRHP